MWGPESNNTTKGCRYPYATKSIDAYSKKLYEEIRANFMRNLLEYHILQGHKDLIMFDQIDALGKPNLENN